MSRTLRWMLFFLGILASPGFGQVPGPPFVFVAGTVIDPDQMNLNFQTIYDAACNRGGCVMTGSFTGVNGTFSGTLGVTGATTLSSTLSVTGATTLAALSATTGTFSGALSGTTLTLSNTGAAALDVAGGIQAGSGNVGIVDTSGRIPAISSTFFASVSGANLTAIPETAITDGSILARLAATEQVTGAWTFSPLSPTTGNTVFWKGHNAAAFAVSLAGLDGSNVTLFGPSDADIGTGCCNETVLRGPSITLRTNSGGTPVDRTTINGTSGLLTHTAAFALSGTISPSMGGAGQNDWAPTGHAGAYLWRVTTGGGTPTITGIAGGAPGRRILLKLDSGTAYNLAHDSISSSAANRILTPDGSTFTIGGAGRPDFVELVYDGTSSRWLVLATP